MNANLRMLFQIAMVAMVAGCSVQPPAAIATAGFTLVPEGTPGPGATAVGTATATPAPIVRVESGDTNLFHGDYEAAVQEYRAAANNTTDPEIRAAAVWGLARAQHADGRHDAVVATVEQLGSEFPDSPYAAPARFMEGQSLFATRRYAEAAAAYSAYLTARPGVIDSYVSALRGDALSEAGDHAGALDAYASAQAAPHLDDAQALQIKMAQVHAAAGNTDTALQMYDSIAANTTNDYIRAEMDYLAGQAHLSMEQTAAAHERFTHAVENYPVSYHAYLGLVELISAGVAVSDLDRGLTDYFAGVYDKGLEALNRYIDTNPSDDGTAYYYRALCLGQLQLYEEAVDALADFIQRFPSHPKWADAWNKKSSIEWFNLNRYPEAAQTMIDYAGAAPTSADAPEALFTAARILERDGRFDEAGLTWRRIGDEYPTYEQASTTMLFAGIMQFRQTDYQAALPLFERSLVLAVTTEDQARAHLWIGKARERLGDPIDAQNSWQLAQSADPGGYYSERAADLLNDRPPFSPASSINLGFDLTAERRAADSWMRLTFELPAEADVSGPDSLATDPRLIRGRELWNLGLYDDARLEFEDLRSAVSDDAVLSYRLANYLLDLGLYRSGIFAARRVLFLAGMEDQASSMLAPPYFSHVRYGLYYGDLVLPAAEENGLDPLLLFSILRQESLFEGFVSSSAGARGLMQIIPSTGADISNQVRWPIEYEPDDLYRPNVSVAYGSRYLADNLRLLDGDPYAALAAYNAGPGNAVAWKQLAQDDPDLFLETVRAQETRDYIRRIYEIYSIYRRLYGPAA